MLKVAIIGSGIMAKTIADRAKELNVKTYCFSFDEKDVACSCVDVFYKVDIFNIDEIVRICRKEQINGVIATTELTILPAAKIADELKLNGNPVELAQNITNKNFIRRKLKGATKISQPKYCFYSEGEIPSIDYYPAIVKPIAAGGKRGINVVNNKNELESAIENAIPYSHVKGVLIEQYICDGHEYSVESLSYNGNHYVVQITEKDTSGAPHCNELGHHQPAQLSNECKTQVREAIVEMLTIVGVQNGPCHTEIKFMNNKVYLIELNARPGGDHITYPLTELSTGYPFVSGIIWIALGLFKGHEPVKLESNFAGIYFITEETAYLEKVFDDCSNYPWLYLKHKVTEGPSKIKFNDEEGINYFIYFDKEKRPDIKSLI